MFLAAFIAVIWGVNFVVSAIFVDHMPPMLFAAVRFVLVIFPAILFVPRPGIGWRRTVGVGFFIGVLQFSFMFISMHLGMSGGLASLLIQLQTLFTVLLAAVFLAERPTPRQMVGIALGLVGLAIVGLGRGGAAMLPFVLMIAAAFFWGCGNCVMRSAKVKSGLSLTVWSSLVAPVPLFLGSLVVDGPTAIGASFQHVDWWFVIGMIYTAYIATLFGFAVWSRLLAKYPAGVVVPWSLMTPPAGIVTAIVVRGEYPTTLEVVGAVVIILAVLLTTINLRAVRLRRTL